MLPLKDCSEVTKLDSIVSLFCKNFHFLRSGQLSSQGLAVQPRSDSGLAERSEASSKIPVAFFMPHPLKNFCEVRTMFGMTFKGTFMGSK